MLRMNTVSSHRVAWPEFRCRKAWCRCVTLPFLKGYRILPPSHELTLRVSPTRDRNLGAVSKIPRGFQTRAYSISRLAFQQKFLSNDGWIDSLNCCCHILDAGSPRDVAVREGLCFSVSGLTGFNTLLHLLASYPYSKRTISVGICILQMSYPGFGDGGYGVSLVKFS